MSALRIAFPVLLMLLSMLLSSCSSGREHAPPPTHRPGEVRPTPAPAPAPHMRDLGDGADGEPLGGRLTRPRPPIHSLDDPSQASSFAIDVDTASYARVRADLRAKRRPAVDAVRSEELVNAFAYAYPEPDDEAPLAITTQTVACPWRSDALVVRIGVAARTIAPADRPAANLVFLIDVSGSMSRANRLPLVTQGLSALVARLEPRDRVAIVTYAGNARVALPSTSARERVRIRDAIKGLRAGGRTHGSAGIRKAYHLAREAARPGDASRVILATDGDFNLGAGDPGELAALVQSQADAGIHLTVLGVGMGGAPDHRLQELADRGDGIHAYLDDEEEALRVLVDDLPRTLTPVADEVKIQVFVDPALVSGWRLIGYDNRRLAPGGFDDDRTDGGEVNSGHQVTALYEVVPRRGGDQANPLVAAADEDARSAATLMRVRLRWQEPGGGASRLIEHDVPAGVVAPGSGDRDTAWALAVAGFAMLLGDDSRRHHCSWDLVLALAERGGAPDDPMRAEFLELARRAQRIYR